MNTSQITEIVKNVIMQQKQDMSLELAKAVSSRVEERARQMGVKAVIVVMNSGANPVLVHCMDDSFIASYDVAFNKAYTVVGLKMPTIKLKELAQPGGSLYGIPMVEE